MLRETESPEAGTERFNSLSPVSYALAKAEALRLQQDLLQVMTESSVFPPADHGNRLARTVLDEILEERVVSSRGQQKPRGVKRKMSRYHIRRRGPLSTAKHLWTPRAVGSEP